MNYRYLPMTQKDKDDMLEKIGITSSDELFRDIPKTLLNKTSMELKEPLSEWGIKKEFTKLAAKNKDTFTYTSFLGAGVYDHYLPSVVDHMISRSEFYTAYTPYQPEISQGELQAIFEFQTMICELTGMDVANSSMYDGATALAEAVNLSASFTKRKKILISKAVHPETREIIHTFAKGFSLDIVEIDCSHGQTDIKQLEDEIDGDTASIVVQHPNFLGQIEPLKEIEAIKNRQKKTMLITSCNPLSLGYLTPPSRFGADIVVGDTQVFGIPAQYGGPHCGYFASSKKLMRKIPGRIVGETVDEDGIRGYVLTLQTREQHIRREKATSNICSNQALNALASSVFMSLLGKYGIHEMAYQNMQKARYMHKSLQDRGINVTFSTAYFNEIVISLPKRISDINQTLLGHGIIGGYDLKHDYPELGESMLIAITEIRTKEEIDHFVEVLEGIINE